MHGAGNRLEAHSMFILPVEMIGSQKVIDRIQKVVFAVVVAVPLVVDACGCSSPKTIYEVRHDGIIFEGVVESIERWHSKEPEAEADEQDEDRMPPDLVVRFAVAKMIRGPRLTKIDVLFIRSGFYSCNFPWHDFEIGETWQLAVSPPTEAVFVLGRDRYDPDKEGIFFRDFCDLALRLSPPEEADREQND